MLKKTPTLPLAKSANNKYLFIDRDGTLIVEPDDEQVDSIDKLDFLPDVFAALQQLQKAGYRFVMVTNQDGLGTQCFPQRDFDSPHQLMLKIFQSQGIIFESIRICPHLPEADCDCRKPKVGLLMDYLVEQKIDRQQSFVIGDRESDCELANNLALRAIQIGQQGYENWQRIAQAILTQPRSVRVHRQTHETNIQIYINLDQPGTLIMDSGLKFLDHMLAQLGKHSGMSLELRAVGDLAIDDHHTVEDIAIVLGEGIRQALGDKIGIGRYGFVLPMDESLANVALDLSGRIGFQFHADFKREYIGDMTTEMITHFFLSFAEGLRATLHIEITGENHHHMVEASFKAVGRALRQAIQREGNELPTTKGVLE